VGRAAPTKADMLVRAIEDGLVSAEEIAEPAPSHEGDAGMTGFLGRPR
jgi:hypothetical protein